MTPNFSSQEYGFLFCPLQTLHTLGSLTHVRTKQGENKCGPYFSLLLTLQSVAEGSQGRIPDAETENSGYWWLLACSAHSVPGRGTPMVGTDQESVLDLPAVNLTEHLSPLGVTLPDHSSSCQDGQKTIQNTK